MATFAQINTAFGDDDDEHKYLGGNDLGSGESSQSKSPLGGLDMFKNLSSEKKLRADGQLPKKRGPKPDSKPALTRRQELNRQAQRTHRERKEMYIKALEQEVLHLKELFATTTRERDAFADENRRLRELLNRHGIQMPPHLLSPAAGLSSSGSNSGSYAPPSSSSASRSPPSANSALMSSGSPGERGLPPLQQNIDYDNIGIDFVLTLERPCMDHMQMLCVQSQGGSEGDISGHALMGTCPTESHLIERPDVPYPHKMPDMQAGDLLKLLDLSNRLPLSGEITPIMAWVIILKHHYRDFLTASDLRSIKQELVAKVRCYGFGAVLEEFEVEDAVQTALTIKSEQDLVSHASAYTLRQGQMQTVGGLQMF